MKRSQIEANSSSDRRVFLTKGLVAGAVGLVLSDSGSFLHAQSERQSSGKLGQGDAALLRFAAAAEILEADFWIQYNELGGIQDSEVPGGTGNPIYTAKLEKMEEDFPQYIHDNTDDEITHYTFLNAYLESKGSEPVNLDQFRVLPGSAATGSSGKPRLTNLMQLPWTLVGGLGTAAVPTTLIWIRTSSFHRPFRIYTKDSSQRFLELTRTSIRVIIFRQSRTRRHSTCRRSNKAAIVSTLRWRRGLQAWKYCGF